MFIFRKHSHFVLGLTASFPHTIFHVAESGLLAAQSPLHAARSWSGVGISSGALGRVFLKGFFMV